MQRPTRFRGEAHRRPEDPKMAPRCAGIREKYIRLGYTSICQIYMKYMGVYAGVRKPASLAISSMFGAAF